MQDKQGLLDIPIMSVLFCHLKCVYKPDHYMFIFNCVVKEGGDPSRLCAWNAWHIAPVLKYFKLKAHLLAFSEAFDRPERCIKKISCCYSPPQN